MDLRFSCCHENYSRKGSCLSFRGKEGDVIGQKEVSSLGNNLYALEGICYNHSYLMEETYYRK